MNLADLISSTDIDMECTIWVHTTPDVYSDNPVKVEGIDKDGHLATQIEEIIGKLERGELRLNEEDE